jgi:DNA-binding beta-propeller fold protein YncE
VVDPYNGDIYVADSSADVATGEGTVSVIDPTTNTVVGGPIFLGTNEDVGAGVAVDPTTDDVYVDGDDDGTATVSVIDPATNTVATTIDLPNVDGFETVGYPGVAFDADNGDIYVNGLTIDTSTGTLSGTVWEIDPTTNTLANTINLGTDVIPTGMAVDPTNGDVYVTDNVISSGGESGEVSVIGAGNSVSTIDLDTTDPATTAYGVAVEPGGDIYVTDENELATSGEVFVIDPATNTVVGSPIDLGTNVVAQGVAVSPSGGDFYVMGSVGQVTPPFSGEVFVVDPTDNTVTDIAVGDNLLNVGVVDPANGDLYAGAEDAGWLQVIKPG